MPSDAVLITMITGATTITGLLIKRQGDQKKRADKKPPEVSIDERWERLGNALEEEIARRKDAEAELRMELMAVRRDAETYRQEAERLQRRVVELESNEIKLKAEIKRLEKLIEDSNLTNGRKPSDETPDHRGGERPARGQHDGSVPTGS